MEAQPMNYDDMQQDRFILWLMESFDSYSIGEIMHDIALTRNGVTVVTGERGFRIYSWINPINHDRVYRPVPVVV